MGQPSGAEDFQVAEVVALGQPSGAEDFLGTGQGSACRARRAWTVLLLLLLHHRLARGRVLRLLLLLLLLRHGARSFCCGLKAGMVLERGGRSSLLHVARVCTCVPIDVSSGSRLLEHRFLLREPAAGQRSWLGWMTWQRLF